MIPSAANSSNECPKCGTTKKSGKRSCCARGGAWFKSCGDAGNKQFDHTWAEGIQACKHTSSSTSVESPQQAMHHVENAVYLLNTVQSRNNTHQQMINLDRHDCVSNASTAGCKKCVGLVKVAAFCIGVLFTIPT